MKTFEVEVCRIGYSYKTITVEIETDELSPYEIVKNSHNKALELAPNYEFSEKSAEYEVSESEEIFLVKTIIDTWEEE
jgi:hypothetical protein